MKILHIWNIGGTALIARTMNRLFPESHSVVVMRKAWDPSNLTTYGENRKIGELWDDGPLMFAAKVLLYARKFDIIHVHAFDKIVPWLKLLYPGKPVILQYHGSDIRGQWNSPKKVKLWGKADRLLVWTFEMLEGAPQNVIRIENPIDTDLFFPKNPISNGKAFHLSYNADEEAKAVAGRMNLDLVIHDRVNDPIPHEKMPEMFSHFEYYVDIKRKFPGDPILPPGSRTALEALSCGLKVLTADGEVMESFPEKHRPENVARELWKVYSGLYRRLP